MPRLRPLSLALSTGLLLPAACSQDVGVGGDFGGTAGSTGAGASSGGASGSGDATAGGSTGGGSSGGASTGGASSGGASTGGAKFDVGTPLDGGGTGGEGTCDVVDDMNAVPPCMDKAPPDSFDPEVQWSWGPPGAAASVVVPLVANFTDDDMSGTVDLCDVPDVLLVTLDSRLVLLDGATGAEHWTAAKGVDHYTTPAIGDIDGDGEVEVVTRSAGNKVIAFEADGTVKWEGPIGKSTPLMGAFGLADLDADGDVEAYYAGTVYDDTGAVVWSVTAGNAGGTTAADLDGDGDLELLVGPSAYHHDGTVYFANPGIQVAYPGTFAQVANLDDDMDPEVLVSAPDGIALLENDGTVTYKQWSGGSGDAHRPLAIHDFDGDDAPEFGASALEGAFAFGVYEPTPAVLWSGGAVDTSGQSGGTAFDFLGAGVAQAIYADETTFYAYDDTGQVLMSVPRTSLTHIEYPTVADVDNDGSAEILVVSSQGTNGVPQSAPALQVVRDKEDRWVGARRIWNQHTYHVTNVREDGTIPQMEKPHWLDLNTFRTQAQLENGGVCKPPPAG